MSNVLKSNYNQCTDFIEFPAQKHNFSINIFCGIRDLQKML